jgi:hypothetical protein
MDEITFEIGANSGSSRSMLPPRVAESLYVVVRPPNLGTKVCAGAAAAIDRERGVDIAMPNARYCGKRDSH